MIEIDEAKQRNAIKNEGEMTSEELRKEVLKEYAQE